MINPNDLQHLVENHPKLVTAKRSVRYPELRVLKYTNKVFYDNLWNEHPLLVECRGLVVDDDYNVVVKPFTKIFNRHENGTDIDRDEMCTAVTKINGFMGVLTRWNGKNIVSTTGSLDSDYAVLAEKWVGGYGDRLNAGESLIFEIVDPSDPHIIPEVPGAYLIGGSFSETLLDQLFKVGVGTHRPVWVSNVRFSDVVNEVKRTYREGLVVYGQKSGTVLKLKSPYYLVTKLFARMKGEKLSKILDSGQPLRIDEDYLPVVEHLRTIKDKFLDLSEQGKVEYVRGFIEREILG